MVNGFCKIDDSDSPENKLNINSEDNCNNETKANIVNLKYVLSNLMPNILTSFLYFFVGIVETHFIGQIGDIDQLDGLGLGVTYNNLTIFFLGIGLIESMASVCSKSFGLKNYKQLGQQTNQVRIIATGFFLIFLMINLTLSDKILILLAGQKPYIHYANIYLKYTIPSMFFELHFEIFCKYSETHLLYSPVIVCNIIGVLVHPINCYIFINYFDMGIAGAGLAASITSLIKFLMILDYFYFTNPFPESNFPITKASFEWDSMWYMIKISTFSMFIFFAESAGFSINNVIASRLCGISYAKYLVGINIGSINYALNYGWLNTSCILVGNYVGENSPQDAKKCIKYLFYIGVVFETIALSSFYIFESFYVRFFSSDERVFLSPDMHTIILLLIFIEIFDFMNAFAFGVLRGCDIYMITSATSIIMFIIVMPILSLLLAFTYNYDIFGVFTGELISYIIIGFIWSYYFICNFDLNKVCINYHEGIQDQNFNDDEIFEFKQIIN